MFEFIYNLFNRKIDTAALEKDLDKIDRLASSARQEYFNGVSNGIGDDAEEDVIEPAEDMCYKSIGKITSLRDGSGLINKATPFSVSSAPKHLSLKEGQTVSYLWYQKENEAIKVSKILEIVEDNWNEPVAEESIAQLQLQRPEAFLTMQVLKVGYISQRCGNTIGITGEGEEFYCTLDIEMNFSPRRFDQVSFLCKVQRDPKNVFEDGSCVEIIKLEPNIDKIHIGTVTQVKTKEWGLVDDEYYFYWDALESAYRNVNVGDKVKVNYLQCEQIEDSVHRFRCLTVVLVDSPLATVEARQLDDALEAQGPVQGRAIEIESEIQVDLNGTDETKPFSIMVKNVSAAPQQVLRTVFLGKLAASRLRLISPSRNDTFFIQPGDAKQFQFEAKAETPGTTRETFFIEFSGSPKNFRVYRNITIIPNGSDQLQYSNGSVRNANTTSAYMRKVSQYDRVKETIRGVSMKRGPNFVKTKFQSWNIPQSLMNLLIDSSSQSYITQALDQALPFLNRLDQQSYASVFHHLLYLEEIEMCKSMKKYYMREAFFKREGEYLSLKVQNIGESRPSLCIGDSVEIFSPFESMKQDGKKRAYEGKIHVIKKDRILLKFNDSFQAQYNSEDYEIFFKFSRVPLRKQHHAIDLVVRKVPALLFPNRPELKSKQVDVTLSETGELISSDDVTLPWFNQSLNIVQKMAVKNILEGVSRPLPYVIFGPPGTGKTVTVIEAILQIYKRIPHSRILVATPSNSSANLITERIANSGVLLQGEFIRLVGENSIIKEMIPDHIIRFCGTVDIAREGTTRNEGTTTEEGRTKLTASGLKFSCNSKFLKLRRVLIGTCITLGSLLQCDFPDNHFTHVIIDESGQCLETEIMVPISLVDKNQGQVILAGDHMQLGPIVLSHYASTRGLEQSYLERLLLRRLYSKDKEGFEDGYDPRLITRLVYNYRSLPSIMKVYNELFYDGDLKPKIDPKDSPEAELLSRLHESLPNSKTRDPSFGVIFYGVEGQSKQCADSPSWLNTEEACHVQHFFYKLVKLGFKADDIGIITPYTQQVKTIREIIENPDLITPKVGTVEEFQGQERKIILVSTVRTIGREISESDKKHKLGFVGSSKRMNVVVSRARALLVIFGSPRLLVKDPNWSFLLNYCVKNNSADIDCNLSLFNNRINDDDM